MSYSEKINCDVCGIEKKETNHWFMFEISKDKPALFLWPWGDGWMKCGHLCSEGCAAKLQSQTLNIWKQMT